ncbi:MAG TPA: class I SAM-dependent methyltransferase [Clostridia bacterium]|nr:class I SAM-dependent methyltransferase [Clostridia bacterium]
MMFEWKPDMVRFMRDASGRTDFHKTLVGRMLPHIAPNASVCDAGCGLGYLSLALSPHVRQVTAVDVNADALQVLRENCARRGIANIRIVQGDMVAYDGEPFDAMIFCLYGQIGDILALSTRFCLGTVCVVKRNEPFHRFSVGKHKKEGDGCADACAELAARGIPYVEQPLTLALDQPFRSLEDAKRFFALYGKDEDPEMITDAFLQERLRTTQNKDFPYVLPSARTLCMIAFSARDLPG